MTWKKPRFLSFFSIGKTTHGILEVEGSIPFRSTFQGLAKNRKSLFFKHFRFLCPCSRFAFRWRIADFRLGSVSDFQKKRRHRTSFTTSAFRGNIPLGSNHHEQETWKTVTLSSYGFLCSVQFPLSAYRFGLLPSLRLSPHLHNALSALRLR